MKDQQSVLVAENGPDVFSSNILSPNFYSALEQRMGKDMKNWTQSSIELFRELLQNRYLEVSKINIDDMRNILRDDFQIPKDDIDKYFEKVLENFDSKNVEQKLEVFIQIFDILVGKPIKETDSKWLQNYIREEYQPVNSTFERTLTTNYDQADIFEKIKIILNINHELEMKNGTVWPTFSNLLICFALLISLTFKLICN
ncbi:hypothetical protein HHI36_008226 [Cryptolaemus montrouzieri]|uniref:Uncharacterized protein n=1 Tax=Cryptolaemus montrouzieri TaxID=559131 RepID=A0ABD2MRR2_9CUCU